MNDLLAKKNVKLNNAKKKKKTCKKCTIYEEICECKDKICIIKKCLWGKKEI